MKRKTLVNHLLFIIALALLILLYMSLNKSQTVNKQQQGVPQEINNFEQIEQKEEFGPLICQEELATADKFSAMDNRYQYWFSMDGRLFSRTQHKSDHNRVKKELSRENAFALAVACIQDYYPNFTTQDYQSAAYDNKDASVAWNILFWVKNEYDVIIDIIEVRINIYGEENLLMFTTNSGEVETPQISKEDAISLGITAIEEKEHIWFTEEEKQTLQQNNDTLLANFGGKTIWSVNFLNAIKVEGTNFYKSFSTIIDAATGEVLDVLDCR